MNELQCKFQNDFDSQLTAKCLETAASLEKSLHQKYKIHYERDKVSFQEKLLA